MTISTRAKRIAIWMAGLACAGALLSSKGADPSRLVTVTVGSAVGGLVGFGFGIMFAKPRTSRERSLRVLYSTCTFGIIGTIFGMADPGVRPAVVGALIGMVTGGGVGFLLFVAYRPPTDRLDSGTVPTKNP